MFGSMSLSARPTVSVEVAVAVDTLVAWVSLAPVMIQVRHAEEACRVPRQRLPVAVEEYVSEQREGKRKREGEDDWPVPRRGDIAGSWSWKGAEGIT
eukprot:COSAG04_NODE_1344_length_7145_cov_59.296764_1_plen_97_part_00